MKLQNIPEDFKQSEIYRNLIDNSIDDDELPEDLTNDIKIYLNDNTVFNERQFIQTIKIMNKWMFDNYFTPHFCERISVCYYDIFTYLINNADKVMHFDITYLLIDYIFEKHMNISMLSEAYILLNTLHLLDKNCKKYSTYKSLFINNYTWSYNINNYDNYPYTKKFINNNNNILAYMDIITYGLVNVNCFDFEGSDDYNYTEIFSRHKWLYNKIDKESGFYVVLLQMLNILIDTSDFDFNEKISYINHYETSNFKLPYETKNKTNNDYICTLNYPEYSLFEWFIISFIQYNLGLSEIAYESDYKTNKNTTGFIINKMIEKGAKVTESIHFFKEPNLNNLSFDIIAKGMLISYLIKYDDFKEQLEKTFDWDNIIDIDHEENDDESQYNVYLSGIKYQSENMII